MNRPKWLRLREAAAASSSPALERPGIVDADGDVDSPSGDGDSDDTTCTTCGGEGIHNGEICTTCNGSGSMKESDPVVSTMCAVCYSADCNVPDTQRVREAVLTTKARDAIPDSKFAIPSQAPGPGSYPIHDLAHAKNALARSSGKPEEGTVKAAVYKAYPELKPDSPTKEAAADQVTCPTCKGSGKILGGNVTCKTCGGSGKITAEKAASLKKGGGGDGGPPWASKEAEEVLARLERLEQAADVFRSLREAKPESMTPAFSTPTRVKTSKGQEGYQVILIREGRGNAEDDQWYTADSIRELCESGVAEGMQAFGNHPTEVEEEERPERDVKQLVGSYHDVRFAESGGVARAEAVFVPLTTDEAHPHYGWVVTLAEAAVRNTGPQPLAGISLYGLSAGDDGSRPDGTQGRMVSMIRPTSGDIVTNAGAGGGFIRNLMESARALRKSSRKENPVKLAAMQSAIREAVKRVREADTDEARTEAIAELAKLENEKLDDAVNSVEQLTEAAPELVEKIREAAKAETGDDAEAIKEENKRLKESLAEIGDVSAISDVLREMEVPESDRKFLVDQARFRGLKEAKDIRDFVETQRAYEAAQAERLTEKLREAAGLTEDAEIEGVFARVTAPIPADGGLAALREAGIPVKDAS